MLATPWYEPFGIIPLEAAACGVAGRRHRRRRPARHRRATASPGAWCRPATRPRWPRGARAARRPGAGAAAGARPAARRALERYDWARVGRRRPRSAAYRVVRRPAAHARVRDRRTAPHDPTCSWLDEHTASSTTALRAARPARPTLVERWGAAAGRRCWSGGGRLLAAGNGGSAAEAQHLTAELVGRFLQRPARRSRRSPCCAETSSLTAIVNDYGADEVFARQVRGARPAGRRARAAVHQRTQPQRAGRRQARPATSGCTVWALTGPEPNPLAGTRRRGAGRRRPATAAVQEVHLVAVHALCAALDARARLAAGAGRPVSRPAAPAAARRRGRRRAPRPRPARAAPSGSARTRRCRSSTSTRSRDSPGGAGLTALLAAPTTSTSPWSRRRRRRGRRAAARAAHPAGVRAGPAGPRRQHPAQDAGALRAASRCCGWTTAARAPRTACLPADAGRGARRRRTWCSSPTTAAGTTADPAAARGSWAGRPAAPGGLGPAPARRRPGRRLRPRHPEPRRGARRHGRRTPARPTAGRRSPPRCVRALGRPGGRRHRRRRPGAWLSTSADEPYVRRRAGGARPATPAARATGSRHGGAGPGPRRRAHRGGRRRRGRGLGVRRRRWRRGGPRPALPAPGPTAPPSRDPAARPPARRPVTLRPWRPCAVAAAARWWPPAAASTSCTPGTSPRCRRRAGSATAWSCCSTPTPRCAGSRARTARSSRAEDRARVLLGLRSVDAVVVFDEDDPRAVLDRLRPDVWAKGGDYDASRPAGARAWSAAGAAGSCSCPTWPAAPPPRSCNTTS